MWRSSGDKRDRRESRGRGVRGGVNPGREGKFSKGQGGNYTPGIGYWGRGSGPSYFRGPRGGWHRSPDSARDERYSREREGRNREVSDEESVEDIKAPAKRTKMSKLSQVDVDRDDGKDEQGLRITVANRKSSKDSPALLYSDIELTQKADHHAQEPCSKPQVKGLMHWLCYGETIDSFTAVFHVLHNVPDKCECCL